MFAMLCGLLLLCGILPGETYAPTSNALYATREPENTSNPLAIITDFLYHPTGEVYQTVDPRGVTTDFSFDALGRATVQIEAVGTPAERRTEFDHDDDGRVTAIRAGSTPTTP
ncbi:MAG: hypothetical protein L0241_13405, partial [Planctomycetia bacterium]|nr:hypothetical protein [Planctomycetia bacterium]